jgi:hypothetical protein
VIVFVSTPQHAYALEQLLDPSLGVAARSMGYVEVMTAPALPRATYVFTDMDRLPLRNLRDVALRWRQLRDRGMRMLNDPARMLSRYGLLRRLADAGINHFNAYRVDEGRLPERWPVFLRCEGDHRGPTSDLIHGPAALSDEIARAVDGGMPLSAMLIIEYAAEEAAPGLFRKYACYRVGDAAFASMCIDGDGWAVKYGREEVPIPPELTDEEYHILRNNPWGPALAPAFEIAGVEFGRADFGLVGGRPQIYEVNTNPHVMFGRPYPQPLRDRSFALLREHFRAALRSIDTTDG